MNRLLLCGFQAVSALLMLAPTGVAQGENSDGFGWSITPYLWATETRVDLTFQDADIGAGEVSFGELLDVLDAAFMVHVEAGRDNWTAFGDLTYLKTSDSTERAVFVVNSNSERIIFCATKHDDAQCDQHDGCNARNSNN